MLWTRHIEATRQIVATSPHIRVLMVTMFEDPEAVFAALRPGALGYVLKHATKTERLRAVQAVAHGEGIFSAGVAKLLASFFSSPHSLIPRTAFPVAHVEMRMPVPWIQSSPLGRFGSDLHHGWWPVGANLFDDSLLAVCWRTGRVGATRSSP